MKRDISVNRKGSRHKGADHAAPYPVSRIVKQKIVKYSEKSLDNSIHSSAIISPRAELGTDNHIAAGVTIEDDVVLGNGNTLMQGVVLKSGTRLGNNNTVHEYAVIGGLPQDLGFEDRTSCVQIGDGNVLREYVTINRAATPGSATTLGNENYLMTQVHLGHDCVLADNVIIAPGAGLGGYVNVAKRAFISGGVMVHQFVHVGTLAMVGGNAKITQNVLPYMITDGVPGKVRGLNLVGLKRAGFNLNDIRMLKKAYWLIHRSGLNQDVILGQLKQIDSSHVTHLADFIANSKRSYHREK